MNLTFMDGLWVSYAAGVLSGVGVYYFAIRNNRIQEKKPSKSKLTEAAEQIAKCYNLAQSNLINLKIANSTAEMKVIFKDVLDLHLQIKELGQALLQNGYDAKIIVNAVDGSKVYTKVSDLLTITEYTIPKLEEQINKKPPIGFRITKPDLKLIKTEEK